MYRDIWKICCLGAVCLVVCWLGGFGCEPATVQEVPVEAPREQVVGDASVSTEWAQEPVSDTSPTETGVKEQTIESLAPDMAAGLPRLRDPVVVEPVKGLASILIQPAIAFGKDGKIGLSFTTSDKTTNALIIHFALLDSTGKREGSSVQLDTLSGGGKTESAICALSGGGYAVAWSVDTKQGSTGNLKVFFRLVGADGVPKGTEDTEVTTDRTGNHWLAKIGCTTDGGFVVTGVRPDTEGKTFDVFFRRYDATGKPVGEAVAVHEKGEGTQAYPAVGIGPDGEVIVSWDDAVNNIERVLARVFLVDGTKGEPVVVAGGQGSAAKTSNVAVHPTSGHFLVSASVNNGQTLAFKYFEAKAKNPSLYSLKDSGKALYNANVVPLATGVDFAAVYLKQTDTRTVMVALLGPNGETQTPLALGSATNLPPYKPHIAHANGRIAVVWTHRIDSKVFSIKLAILNP